MTPSVQTLTEETPLEEVVYQMERNCIKRVPVLRGLALAGIITRANVMRAVISLAHQAVPAAVDDAAIRERLLAELEKQAWAPVAIINVDVTNGVVKLSGVLMDERERQALRVSAENIPGVKKVEDHLVWIEPMSGTMIDAPTET